uniref:Uncharacterized protein n=1 Tax=Arundo donax TaxID=35708 RepID=A0A0A9GFT6_ARUDO
MRMTCRNQPSNPLENCRVNASGVNLPRAPKAYPATTM